MKTKAKATPASKALRKAVKRFKAVADPADVAAVFDVFRKSAGTPHK
jgi:hypothetical protein